MPADMESMFYVREKPWHGLGTYVEEAPTSQDALRLAGLDWNVIQKPIFLGQGEEIRGYKANVRDSDGSLLGVVSDRYKVVQNREAFAFTDALLGEGVKYETAGSLQGGKKVWLLARLPKEYIISGERISPYLVFTTSHDGSGAVKVAITPIRIVCNNTLNLALKTADRSFSMMHTQSIQSKIQEAHDTLLRSERYMDKFEDEVERLQNISMNDNEVSEYIEQLLPLSQDATPLQVKNVFKQREDLKTRYYNAPDLRRISKSAYRFINAVSDFATHNVPLRKTVNYNENLFMKTIDGNHFIDKAYQMVA